MLLRYATVAKRVNVKKLKHDLWSHLEDSMVPGSCAEENTAPGQKIKLEKSQSQPNVLSFQDVISDISNEQKQKDVSLSFYFICLLHLANEKVLAFFISLFIYANIAAFAYAEFGHKSRGHNVRPPNLKTCVRELSVAELKCQTFITASGSNKPFFSFYYPYIRTACIIKTK